MSKCNFKKGQSLQYLAFYPTTSFVISSVMSLFTWSISVAAFSDVSGELLRVYLVQDVHRTMRNSQKK